FRLVIADRTCFRGLVARTFGHAGYFFSIKGSISGEIAFCLLTTVQDDVRASRTHDDLRYTQNPFYAIPESLPTYLIHRVATIGLRIARQVTISLTLYHARVCIIALAPSCN